jgi:hypothetical protein
MAQQLSIQVLLDAFIISAMPRMVMMRAGCSQSHKLFSVPSSVVASSFRD